MVSKILHWLECSFDKQLLQVTVHNCSFKSAKATRRHGHLTYSNYMLSFGQLRWCYYVNLVEISKVLHDIDNEDKQNLFTTDRIGNISLYLKKNDLLWLRYGISFYKNSHDCKRCVDTNWNSTVWFVIRKNPSRPIPIITFSVFAKKLPISKLGDGWAIMLPALAVLFLWNIYLQFDKKKSYQIRTQSSCFQFASPCSIYFCIQIHYGTFY